MSTVNLFGPAELVQAQSIIGTTYLGETRTELLKQILVAVANRSGSGGAPTVLAYAATLTPSLAGGSNKQVMMTGDLTLNGPTGGSNGDLWQVRLIASGAIRTITLGTDIVTPTGTTFSGAVADGSTRLLQMIYNGTKWWVVRNQEFTA